MKQKLGCCAVLQKTIWQNENYKLICKKKVSNQTYYKRFTAYWPSSNKTQSFRLQFLRSL